MSELQIISTDALAQGNGIALIDVRLADDFASAHLPGATSNCVFEVPFVERMKEIAPDPATSVVVYGAGPDSHESRMAAEKLLRAGYTHVKDYRDGLEGWIAAGHAIEGAGADAATAPAPSGRFQLDLAESKLEWLGRNLLNKHWGTAPLTSGFVEVQDGMVTGGEFTIDLTGLACTDLEGSDLHDVLIGHLASDDFFDTANFPEATFRVTGSSPITGSAPGLPNLQIQGELTLKGITSPLTLDAATGLTPEGLPAAQAAFALDRTQWNVIYGSARFFKRLAGHLVNDMIEFQARIVTQA